MCEKRGYPNPNYTEEDIREGIPLEMNAEILIDDKEYRELVGKAHTFDIIVNEIKSKIDFNAYTSDYSLVDDDMILQVTGMAAYRRRKIFEEDQKAKATASAEEPEKEVPENE